MHGVSKNGQTRFVDFQELGPFFETGAHWAGNLPPHLRWFFGVRAAAAELTLLTLYSNFETNCFTHTSPPTWLSSKIIPIAEQHEKLILLALPFGPEVWLECSGRGHAPLSGRWRLLRRFLDLPTQNVPAKHASADDKAA